MIIQPAMAAFLAELAEASDGLLAKHNVTNYAPVDIRIYTCDGYTARLLEEGIELYPKEPTS